MKTNKISKKATKQMVARYNRRIARDNKAFEALKPWEKRVAIARDVLAQIRNKRLIPRAGIWLSAINGNIVNETLAKKNPELRDVLGNLKKCEGCALGGMFMCAVERADKLKLDKLEAVKTYKADLKDNDQDHKYVTMDDGISENDAFNYLRKFFAVEQLALIEAAFERNEGAYQDDVAADFCGNEDDPSERMRLIMENIVVNKGRFCPTKKPVMAYVTLGFTG